MLGLIILAGIVVNNAILIVHQSLNFRRDGLDPDEALRRSCQSRLRPISMSVITSLLGMLPLAVRVATTGSFPFIDIGMASGSGTELYRGLGAVLLGGLLVSTLFTLFLVPALLSLVQDVQALLARFGSGRTTADNT
jgi:HAE1 family hydrophobic/amphiphilic exporter-1